MGPRACIGEHLALVEMSCSRDPRAPVRTRAGAGADDRNRAASEPPHAAAGPHDGDDVNGSALDALIRNPHRRARCLRAVTAAFTTSPARPTSARVPYAELRGRALGMLRHLQARRTRRHANHDPGRRPRAVRRHVLGLRTRAAWSRCRSHPAMPTSTRPSSSACSREWRRRRSRPSARSSTPAHVRRRQRPRPSDRAARKAHGHPRRDRGRLRPGKAHRAKPDDIAFIQFSSGSTSEPKGVILTHRNLATNIDAIAHGGEPR